MRGSGPGDRGVVGIDEGERTRVRRFHPGVLRARTDDDDRAAKSGRDGADAAGKAVRHDAGRAGFHDSPNVLGGAAEFEIHDVQPPVQPIPPDRRRKPVQNVAPRPVRKPQ